MRPEKVFYCIYLLALLTNVFIDADGIDSDQTAPTRWFDQDTFSRRQKQTALIVV